MTLLEEVKAFARDFINGNRTEERLLKVKAAYRQITDENLRITCETCYIEAIFKILRYMETPRIPCRYRLKKGAILQPFSGGIVTNENLTDAIAEECLRTIRGAAVLFAEMPAPAPEPDLKIVPVVDQPPAVNDDAATGQPPAVNDDAATGQPPAVNDDAATGQPPATVGAGTTINDDLGASQPPAAAQPATVNKATPKSKSKTKAKAGKK
jgi:hypothetical protein